MKNIWVRITLGAGAIFAVGMILVTIIKAGRSRIEDLVHSDADIRIPLMGIVPFQLAEARLGDLRRLTLLRDAPQHLSGVRVEVRLADSASIEVFKDCTFLTVNDAEHLNENTRFACVTDTTGLSEFGTVEIEHRQGDTPTTLVRTLMLPDAQLAALQAEMGPRVGVMDSAQLAALEGMGDSIRAATLIQVELAREQARAARHAPNRVRVQEVPAVPPAPATPAPTP